MTEAVWPTTLPMRDSLELWVRLNIALKRTNTSQATTHPPTAESGALAQTLLVAGIRVRIRPNAPNAVTNDASTVGLKNEMPGIPV